MHGVQENVERGHNQRDGAQKLDQHMERWASCIFERITNSITNNTGFVCFAALAQDERFRIKVIGYSSSRLTRR